ncbi:hypothetical protein KIN20_033308 [Parelaphostrongylus tenuis]|uniref:Uncharacterized protein n=1 Tax=Parelaphostrongylus tenuis TaxID=148309 RepID=A0AAD5R7U6_PARTN|nr:hypothetical protein KIN20_033308 [Parelaphostrongylus tenuis]
MDEDIIKLNSFSLPKALLALRNPSHKAENFNGCSRTNERRFGPPRYVRTGISDATIVGIVNGGNVELSYCRLNEQTNKGRTLKSGVVRRKANKEQTRHVALH